MPTTLLDLIASDIVWVAVIAIVVLLGKHKKNTHKYSKINAVLNFKIKLDNSIKTILIPALLSIALFSVFALTSKQKIIAYDVPLAYLLISAVVIAPIAEELLCRGILLGCFLYCSRWIKNKYARISFIAVGFLLQLSIFVIFHLRTKPFEIVMLAANGFLFSILFLAYRTNLLPSIIAHAVSNLAVILTNF